MNKEDRVQLICEHAGQMLRALEAVVQWQKDEGPLAGKGPYEVAKHCDDVILKVGRESLAACV